MTVQRMSTRPEHEGPGGVRRLSSRAGGPSPEVQKSNPLIGVDWTLDPSRTGPPAGPETERSARRPTRKPGPALWHQVTVDALAARLWR